MATQTLEEKNSDDEAPVEKKQVPEGDEQDNQGGAPAEREGGEEEIEERKGPENERISEKGDSAQVGKIDARNVEEESLEGKEVCEEKEVKKEQIVSKEGKEEESEEGQNSEAEYGPDEKEENVREEEVREEDKKYDKTKASRKGTSKQDRSESKKLNRQSSELKTSKESAKKEGGKSSSFKEPVTPSSDRPARERKTVERFSLPSPGRSSASKGLSFVKGRGIQLKDIPNVAFKLSKRKPDDNLQILHTILFGKKAKPQFLKRNIGQFSGYVWDGNEEKQRSKVKDKIDKCVKEKLADFCDVLNIPFNKAVRRKEEMSVKLLEFLESPHVTTDILLANKEEKGKKRKRKGTAKSSGEASVDKPAENKKQIPQAGKKRIQSSKVEDDENEAELADAKVDSHPDDSDSEPHDDSYHEEIKSEEEEDKPRVQGLNQKSSSKIVAKESPIALTVDKKTPARKMTGGKALKSLEKSTKKSTSKRVTSPKRGSASLSKSKESASKRQKREKENEKEIKEKGSGKQAKKSTTKVLAKNQGKGKSSKKVKLEPNREEMHAVVVDILKEVDFNTATLSDILRQLGSHFGLDLMHRKEEVKEIITDVINNMSDEDDEEEAEDASDVDEDKDGDHDDGGDDDA